MRVRRPSDPSVLVVFPPQVDKLEASESLRKQEEQATESQPIVYGKKTQTRRFVQRRHNQPLLLPPQAHPSSCSPRGPT